MSDEGRKPDAVSGLKELREALSRPVPTSRDELERDVHRLLPLIVPSEYERVGVPAVYDPLPSARFALTWVLMEPTTMLYLRPTEASRFDAERFSWKARAFANLEKDWGPIATHERRAEDGRLIFHGAMQPDGLGSSRLLLAARWKLNHPDGYWVALPDRSCGLVVSKAITREERAEVANMVREMFNHATTPMCGDLLEPGEIDIPSEWAD